MAREIRQLVRRIYNNPTIKKVIQLDGYLDFLINDFKEAADSFDGSKFVSTEPNKKFNAITKNLSKVWRDNNKNISSQPDTSPIYLGEPNFVKIMDEIIEGLAEEHRNEKLGDKR